MLVFKLMCAAIPSFLALIATKSFADSYYDAQQNVSGIRQKSPVVWGLGNKTKQAPQPSRNFIVDSESDVNERSRLQGEMVTTNQQPTDPSRFNGPRAIKELEEGVAELKDLGIEMADHIRKNGAAGIYNMPEGIIRHGRSLGNRIGTNVKEVGGETAQDMLTK